MIGRLGIFFAERFPLHQLVASALLSYFGLYFVTQALYGPGRLQLTATSAIGLFTVVGLMLLMRIFDEFKDVETDRRLFPERPLARGAVEYHDIRVLGIAVFVVLVALNLLQGWAFVFFAAMMLFAWLTSRWFFSKERLIDDLVLTLITHQPVALFVNAYVVATAVYGLKLAGVAPAALPIAVLAFWFPVLAWETSRKIRARGRETDYVTYSKLFGPRRATLLPLIGMGLYFLSIVFLALWLHLGAWAIASLLLIALALAVVFIRFLSLPNENRLILTPATQISVTASLLLTIVALLLQRGLSIGV
jgi:4-hydroxybenzoate polyprenyltransferase